MWVTAKTAGRKSDVGVTFKKGGSRRNYPFAVDQVHPLTCMGVGQGIKKQGSRKFVKKGSTDQDQEAIIDISDDYVRLKPLSAISWQEARHGIKSNVGKDVTSTKGGNSRHFPSKKSQISLMSKEDLFDITHDKEVLSPKENITQDESDLILSPADRMLRSLASLTSPREIFAHGKSSPIGFDATFAKYGSRRNYNSPESKIFLPVLEGRKSDHLEDGKVSHSLPLSSSDYVLPISPVSYPILYRSTPQELNMAHGKKSNIGNDITFAKMGNRRVIAGPKSQGVMEVIRTEDDLADDEVSCLDLEDNEDQDTRESDGMPFVQSTDNLDVALLRCHSALSPSSKSWLDANLDCYGYGRKSNIGNDITFAKGGSRRNYPLPEPQVSMSFDGPLSSTSPFTEELDLDRDADDSFSEFSPQMFSPTIPMCQKYDLIGGKKSDVGVTVFTGAVKKPFLHPASQISIPYPSPMNSARPLFPGKASNIGGEFTLQTRGRRTFATPKLQVSFF